MTAPTIVTLELPHQRTWLWYPDLNILALAPHLTADQRAAAVNEFMDERRHALLAAATTLAV